MLGEKPGRAMTFLVESAAKHEVQLQRMRDVIERGMRIIVTFQTESSRKLDALIDAQLRPEEKLAQLANAQAGTEQKLQGLLDFFKKPNGNQ